MKKFLLVIGFILCALSAYSAELPKGTSPFASASEYNLTLPALNSVDVVFNINDTVKTVSVFGAKRVWVTFVDSSNSKTDSMAILHKRGKSSANYSKLSCLDASATSKTTFTSTDLLIPTDGSTVTYELYGDAGWQTLYIYRKNVGGVTGAVGYPYRTKCTVTWEK